MNLMEDVPEIQINQNAITDENFIDKSFDHGLNNEKRTTQHMFLKDNWVNWKVSYFCKMIKHSLIMKKEQKVISFFLKQTKASITIRVKGNK